jgi:putative SOS response-associated peptidase YedK
MSEDHDFRCGRSRGQNPQIVGNARIFMCGRYAITTAPEAMRSLFRYEDQPNFPPRYNIAPTQPIPIVRVEECQRRFALVRWGLIPSWVKDPRTFSLLINARGESLLDKPAFRSAMRYRRCLIPADGFYEWRREGSRKQPYYVHLRAGGLIAFAGLWENWTGPNGEEMETAAVVTTLANRTLQSIHERMPVIISPEAFHIWLDCRSVDAKTAAALIAPAPNDLLETYEVSAAVNRTANDSSALIQPLSHLGSSLGGVDKTSERASAKQTKDDGQASLF